MRAPLASLVLLTFVAVACGDEGTEGSSTLACGDREVLVDGECVCAPNHYGDDCSPCDCPDGTYCADGANGDGACLEAPITCGETEALAQGECICLPGHYGEECTPCDCPDGTYCADGKKGDGSCSEEPIVCGETEALAQGECICLPGHYGDDCTPCDCPEDTFCRDGRAGDGSCLGQKLVACLDVAPSNATSVIEQVTVTYTDADGWSEPAACAWTCDTDWFREGDQCIDTRLEACADVSPDNATPVFALVETTYTTADGWSAPAPCDWTCLTGYRESDGECVTTPEVVSATPEDGDLASGGVVTLEFSESMDTASVEHAITVTPSIDLVFTWSDAARRVTIEAAEPYQNLVLYTLEVGTGARDVEGNGLEQPYSLSYYGAAWVTFYGSADKTTGDLVGRAQGLDLSVTDARDAADALCVHPSFATVPAGCSQAMAVLSVSQSDELRNLPSRYGLPMELQVRARNGYVIEDEWAGLLDGQLGDGSLSFQYNGVFPNDGTTHLYWTGSNVDGSFNNSSSACDNWTNGTTSRSAQNGSAFETGTQWIARGAITCQNLAHLLCACW